MAEVTQGHKAMWTGANRNAQYAAILQLRLRIFRNSLRRKGGKGDLVANLIMVPLFLLFAFVPSIGAGLVGYFAASRDHLAILGAVLWGIFVLSQFTSIQLGQAATVFDPTQLIRFPLSFRGYATIRVFFGLISPANVIAVMASVGVVVGVSVAAPSLWVWATLTMGAFALALIFFTRMAFSWVDRWMSTRRAREVFMGFIFVISFGIQYINFTYNPGFAGHKQTAAAMQRLETAKHVYASAKPVLDLLPPGLCVRALADARTAQYGAALLQIGGVLVFAAAFFAVFAMRLHKEFLGENLSDVANVVSTAKPKVGRSAAVPAIAVSSSSSIGSAVPELRKPRTVATVAEKEFLTLRRTSGVFYAVLAPLIFVVLFVSRLGSHAPVAVVFPVAALYSLMGALPLAYNSLGMEAEGIQFYFLAPVRMRDVMFAKNLLAAALCAIEILAVFATVALSAKLPPAALTIAVFLWAAFTLAIGLAVGNYRSVVAPKKIDPAKMAGKQASPLSALIAFGVLLGCGVVGGSVQLLARALGMPWVMPAAMLLAAVGGAAVYRMSLNSMDEVVAAHRDALSEALTKTSA